MDVYLEALGTALTELLGDLHWRQYQRRLLRAFLKRKSLENSMEEITDTFITEGRAIMIDLPRSNHWLCSQLLRAFIVATLENKRCARPNALAQIALSLNRTCTRDTEKATDRLPWTQSEKDAALANGEAPCACGARVHHSRAAKQIRSHPRTGLNILMLWDAHR